MRQSVTRSIRLAAVVMVALLLLFLAVALGPPRIKGLLEIPDFSFNGSSSVFALQGADELTVTFSNTVDSLEEGQSVDITITVTDLLGASTSYLDVFTASGSRLYLDRNCSVGTTRIDTSGKTSHSETLTVYACSTGLVVQHF